MSLLRRVLLPLALVALVVGQGAAAQASPGDLGHDVSWPQCGAALPSTGVFGVVGVTRGLPFSVNSCLAEEGAWAAATGQPALYTNTANPGHTSTHWPTAGTGRCVDATVDTDAGCAYEYGRAAATDALTQAASALAGTGLDPYAVTWWLDVEGSRTAGQQGNSWVGTGVVNAADLQGFVDSLRTAGVPEVGVYSTAYQWNDITQGYTRGTSASYRAAWPSGAAFPLEDGPVWFAGVGAGSDCGQASFTGGERLQAQWFDGTYDADDRCADPDRTGPTVATLAPSSAVTRTASFVAGWTGADAGGSGLATFDVRTERAPSNGGFQPWAYPPSLQRTAARSASLSGTGQGWTKCVSSRARDGAGWVSSWSGVRCTALPLDDRALTASSGWTRSTGGGFYASTYTSSTRLGATLVRTGLVTSRLTLLAVRCATCGKVGVYVGNTLLATVDLHASTTSLATIALPRFSLRTANVTLRVLSTGKLVRVDGLATSRV